MSSIAQKDKSYIWHPFTQHGVERVPPCIVRAKNASLFTEDGQEILDLISSWWTCTHGHAHPEMNKALSTQAETMEHVMFAGFTHPAAANLSEKLARILPGDLNRVFFSDNGSTAVEVALKLAYQYWKNKGEEKRTQFLAFDGAYHGDTVGAMSVGRGSGFFGVYEGLMFSVDRVPYPFTWDGDERVEEKERDALKAFQEKLNACGEHLAAVIVEPLMQGAGGIRFCGPAFIKQICDVAHAAGVLVIFDEVAVGFGRTGAMFACDKIGVTPDLICLSKGLTAGYMPMSVTVARESIFKAFISDHFSTAFLHGHSFTANPLACAVALKSLELFESENTLTKIAKIEKHYRDFMAELKDQKNISKIRVMGSVLAFNLCDGQGGYKSEEGEFLRDWFLNHGLNIRPLGSAVYLMPPYCIRDEELSRGYDGILEGLSQLEKRH